MRLKQLTLLAVCAIVTVSCTDYKSQISALQNEISNLEVSVDEIGIFADNLGAVRDVLTFNQAGDYIQSVTPVGDGYQFTFKNNGSVTVGNATGGVSVGTADGGYVWTLDGQPLKDATGSDALTKVIARFRARDGKRQVSTDGGKSWTDLPSSPGNLIIKVEENATGVTVTFLGGTTVVFAKENPLALLISGDGSTISSQGKIVVDYLITGGSGEYSIATSQPNGWSPQVVGENDHKGQIVFISSGSPASDEVRIFIHDAAGHMVVTTISLASLTPDETYPVLYSTYDAYNVGYEGGVVEVNVATNLEYEIEVEPEALQWLSVAGTKALRTETISFSAKANESRQMRSAMVTLKSDVYSRTIAIYQEGTLPVVGQNLSENGTANCYIVPAAGDYFFDATVIGNGQAGIIEGAGFHTGSAAINPEAVDVLVEFTEEPIIENLRLENGKVYFHATGDEGNVTVYVMDGEESILWSWHLWCTDMPSEKTHTNADGSQFTLLDRNLGATSADPADGEETFGLYYQWGRKDPFAADNMYTWVKRNSSLLLDYAMERPFTPLTTDSAHSLNWFGELNNYLWGNPDYQELHPLNELAKTIYDPCPPGYIVPPGDTFVIMRDESNIRFITNGFMLRGDYGQTSFYPFAGRVYQSSYEAFGHNQDEIYFAVWNSGASMYNTNVYDGGACTTYRVKTLMMSINGGDFRARGIPVRCVKQK